MSDYLPGLLQHLSALEIAFIVVAAFASAMFHSISGYAGGLILAVMISPIIGVKAIVPVMAVALLTSHTTRAWAFRHGFQWPIYRSVMVTAAPCILIGSSVYSFLPPAAIALLLGIFLLTTVPLRYILQARNLVVGRKSLMGVGVPFGLMAGATIGGGMILAPFFLGAGLTGITLLGTMSVIAFTVNILKTVVFGSFAVLDTGLMATGLLIGLCTVPGNLAGRWVVMHTPIRIHVKLVEGVVLVGGLWFVFASGRDFGWWGV